MIPTPHDLDPCPHGCGELVLWTITEHGRRMAVDAEPHELGNQAVFRTGPGGWRSRSLDGADAPRLAPWEHRYKPHVATCTAPRPAQPAIPGLGGGRPRPRRRAPARRPIWKAR
ncbi:hypothetical protein MF672_010730 [Actinomadura sp. ATCC 31491]|uniref:Uncharacterized protein n=1 Tax=Actinomadura luzonensis TaxID=2805427 RepID=A0ABT0FQT4_9ACTN|nr:hypothetical protein [Actinomadura luzonensis]MCK2214261.1 hypothetical protein [Actinomadura luzonensis]